MTPLSLDMLALMVRLRQQPGSQLPKCLDCGGDMSARSKERGYLRCIACARKARMAPRVNCLDCGKQLNPQAHRTGVKRCGPCHKRSLKKAENYCVTCDRRLSKFAKANGDAQCATCLGEVRPKVVTYCRDCEGLPWRRGNGTPGSVCRRCREPYEEETPLNVLDFTASTESPVFVDSQTMGRSSRAA